MPAPLNAVKRQTATHPLCMKHIHTGFVTVLQYKRYNAYEMQKDARAKIINLVFENFCVLCLSLSCIMDTMATEE